MLDRRLTIFVCAWCGVLALNNLLPYAGLRDDSCQTMFSGLDWTERENNHLFLPQIMLGDRWRYVSIDADIDPPPHDRRTLYLAEWLDRRDRLFNVDAVRAVVWQLCRKGHRVRLTGDVVLANACDDPSWSTPIWWIPVRLYETDFPR